MVSLNYVKNLTKKKNDKEIIKQPYCYHFIYIWDDEHHYRKSNCLGGTKARNPSLVWGERKPI